MKKIIVAFCIIVCSLEPVFALGTADILPVSKGKGYGRGHSSAIGDFRKRLQAPVGNLPQQKKSWFSNPFKGVNFWSFFPKSFAQNYLRQFKIRDAKIAQLKEQKAQSDALAEKRKMYADALVTDYEARELTALKELYPSNKNIFKSLSVPRPLSSDPDLLISAIEKEHYTDKNMFKSLSVPRPLSSDPDLLISPINKEDYTEQNAKDQKAAADLEAIMQKNFYTQKKLDMQKNGDTKVRVVDKWIQKQKDSKERQAEGRRQAQEYYGREDYENRGVLSRFI